MSLRLKMILGIGAILLLVVLVYAIVASRSQATFLLKMARREADLIAAVADRALADAMAEGKREVVRGMLARIGEYADVAGIRIVDPEGVILQSNRAEEVGRALAADRSPRAGKAPEPVWNDLERTVEVFRPILNGPACSGCHPADRPTLGFLNVRVAFPAVDSEMAQQWTTMILSGVAGLIAAGGLIWVLFTFVVGRRVDALSQTMSRVEEGDLTARAATADRDELGRLGKSFNAMVAHLADARRQLEDRHAGEIRRAENLASLGKMAAGIAHEINNPIAGMQNCVRTLLKGARDERQRLQYLTMLQEGLGRIGRIVGQLLHFAREARPRPARTEIPPLLRRCLALLEHELTTRRIACDLKVDGGLPVPLADPHQLEQVFLNVLMNAVEAMPEGGTLTISAGVRRREGSPFVEVRVADTGVGIPAEHLPRIFDPFFTTKEVGRGTGLGLSVSYGIVRSHGGFIEVESAVGKGTAVAVALPVNGH
ncbi:MAG TPA: ATP-binding protein [Candidatus Methylomirabilis sp.]|jgi:signal transduction histidine kinase